MNAAKRVARAISLVLIILSPELAWAQTSNGTLVGSVTDPSGAVVQKAIVSVVSSQYGQPHETRTDSVGTYRLEGLQPGVYSVTITAPGFEVLSVSRVVLSGSLTTTINGKLQLATAQQTIEVQATAAQAIDTQSGQMGGEINRREITELPNLSQNPAQLALTLPGVQDSPVGNGGISSEAATEGVSFSVNGTRPRANNFLIDGQDDNDYGITGQAYQPYNYGAIQEVAVLTNAYSAEYGRGGGSVTNYIFKSGTNNFHGDLWESNRNSAFAAIPAQDAVTNPISKNPYDNENIFGFDAGGPVIKDKLFAFGAVQWDRERQAFFSPNGSYLPTASGISTLEGLLPNPNVALLLSALGPLASTAPASETFPVSLGDGRGSVEIGPFQLQNVPVVTNAYDWNYRMDWHFTDHDSLTGSAIRQNYAQTPNDSFNPFALPNFDTESRGHADIYRGQWVHTISSTLVNELRLSYTNIDFNFLVSPSVAAGPFADTPYITFGTDVNLFPIGINNAYPQGRSHNAWQVQEAVSYAANRHTIKAGVDVTVLSLQDILPLNQRGSINYSFGGTDPSTGGTYSSLANFIDDDTGGTPGGISKSFGNPNFNESATMFAPYIEDTWRAKSDLTLNLGLRYEYWGALADSLPFPSLNTSGGIGLPSAVDPGYQTNPALFDSLFASKQIPDKRNFAPRIGLAYSPHWGPLFRDGKTVIRAGYGIFYDGLFTNITDNTAESQPNAAGGSINPPAGRGTASASTFPGLGPNIFNSFLLIQTMASNLHNPLTQQWNVDVQRELPLGLVLTLAYVGTRGEHLFANQDFNPAVATNAFNQYVYTNPNFGEIEVRTNAGDSWYNAGQLEVERRLPSLVLRASYTYSKFLDDTSDVNLTTGSSTFSQILTDQRSDWGPSAYDRRQRFTLSYVWLVPYVHHNTILKALTDQWQWSSIATIETGTPNTVEVGFDNFNNGHPNSRPNLSNPAAPLTSLGVDGGDFGIPGFVPGMFYPFLCWDEGTTPCDAAPASTFHFIVPNEVPGNVGRNSLYGPGQVYFDTAIQRDFPVHFWKFENQTISFRTDLFNAVNHPNLFTPSYTMTDPLYDNTAVTISGGREIRFWLKYSF